MGACALPTVSTLSVCETGTVQGHFLAGGGSEHKEFVTVMAFKEVYSCEILISEIANHPALYACSKKEYSDKVLKDRLWGEVCEAIVPEWSQLNGPEKRKKGKQCCFSIYLIQMYRFTLICCKIQGCLTLQRKLTLAESYDFPMVVNKDQYFFKLCYNNNSLFSIPAIHQSRYRTCQYIIT
jgi:hypothetical protein